MGLFTGTKFLSEMNEIIKIPFISSKTRKLIEGDSHIITLHENYIEMDGFVIWEETKEEDEMIKVENSYDSSCVVAKEHVTEISLFWAFDEDVYKVIFETTSGQRNGFYFKSKAEGMKLYKKLIEWRYKT